MSRAMGSRQATCVIGALVLTAVAGCGGGSATTTTSTRAATSTPQKPASIPRSWKRKVNAVQGFSIGMPRDWTHSGHGTSVLFRSPDRLVALSLGTRRGVAAFALPPGEFARRGIAALRGYRHPLKPGPTRVIGGTPFVTASVRSEGVARSNGVRQKVEFAVLRRDHAVNFTAVTAANAKDTPHHELEVARHMVRTLRDHPPHPDQRSGRSG
jgi:hypothetical protein